MFIEWILIKIMKELVQFYTWIQLTILKIWKITPFMSKIGYVQTHPIFRKRTNKARNLPETVNLIKKSLLPPARLLPLWGGQCTILQVLGLIQTSYVISKKNFIRYKTKVLPWGTCNPIVLVFLLRKIHNMMIIKITWITSYYFFCCIFPTTFTPSDHNHHLTYRVKFN